MISRSVKVKVTFCASSHGETASTYRLYSEIQAENARKVSHAELVFLACRFEYVQSYEIYDETRDAELPYLRFSSESLQAGHYSFVGKRCQRPFAGSLSLSSLPALISR